MNNIHNILHICTDEKFMGGAAHLFDKAFPESNIFLIILPPANPPIKYFNGENIAIIKIVNHKDIIAQLVEKIKLYNIIVLHGLTQLTAQLILKVSSTKKILWISLGAEVYQNKLLYKLPILGEKTAQLSNKFVSQINLQSRVKNIYRKFRYKKIASVNNPSELIAKAALRINNFGSLIEEEFSYLKTNKLIAANAKYVPLAYYPIEYFAKNENNVNVNVSGNHIMVGNSASFTNNHLEVFDLLRKMALKHQKIIVPLNYGNKKYANAIIKEGERMFNEQFVPLLQFLPLAEYNKTIQSCGIIIMNHYRQQAVGNILTALWQGSKVYLSENNILYRYFNLIGCCVFSIEKELVPDNKNALILLTQQEITNNRQILNNYISEKALVRNLRERFKENFGFR